MTFLAGQFALAMSRLGPFGPAPRLACAVSGGADSTALVLLAQAWAARHEGSVLALIVDHGLRAESAAEAAQTAARLHGRGIAAQILTLSGIRAPALQEKARRARFAALTQAALDAGCLHLLLGHHAADQSETLAMRARRGAGGGEGIAAWSARNGVVLLRPLLEFSPADLRVYLAAHGMGWVEDPSNQNPKFERVRLRQAMLPPRAADAAPRRVREAEAAAFLAGYASLRREGFALLDAPSAPPAALGALIRVLGGADYPPAQRALARLAANLRPETLGGVRIVPAGRLGAGWLLAREPAACAAPVPAHPGVLWDNRFRLEILYKSATSFGALGE
ncbi:MAG TPA: tRNA lysidine(34) synthetase TilS, partial [Acidocella sp.]|nr:tRNA lysidine(34) synthetase TilS [Acidocella sp.]